MPGEKCIHKRSAQAQVTCHGCVNLGYGCDILIRVYAPLYLYVGSSEFALRANYRLLAISVNDHLQMPHQINAREFVRLVLHRLVWTFFP